MAYTATKTSAMQTAVKAGVDVAIAELSAGLITDHEGLVARITEVREEIQALLFAQVDEDNTAIAATSGGSGFSRSGGSSSPISVQDACDTVLNFGAFKNLTLKQVAALTDLEAEAYSAGRYKKSGMDWLRWAAQNKDPKGNFIKQRAQVVLDNINP